MEQKGRPEGIEPTEAPAALQELAAGVGGTLGPAYRLPDGSGFATMSMPLPKDHWSTVNPEEFGVPPMPFRMGLAEFAVVQCFPAQSVVDRQRHLTRGQFADIIREAGKYAYRASTMNGREPDLDPDALLQNLVVGLLGYWTADGLSGDAWANPKDVA
jgi:hypothetical protein